MDIKVYVAQHSESGGYDLIADLSMKSKHIV